METRTLPNTFKRVVLKLILILSLKKKNCKSDESSYEACHRNPTYQLCVCVCCVSLSAAIGADLVDPYLFTTHLTRVLIRWQENEGFRLPDGVGPLQGKFIIIFFF